MYGHFLVSYGVEYVEYQEDKDEVKTAKIITTDELYDYSAKSAGGPLKVGSETVFVNAAWMTGLKRQVPDRNKPVIVDLKLPYQARN